MQAKDVMARDIITVSPRADIEHVAQLMVKQRVSGIPVVDGKAELVGIVTEGDLLRRVETGTEGHCSTWRALFSSNRRLATGYLKSHSRKVCDVMTAPVATVTEDTELEDVADLLESRHIKRLPVMRGGQIVGMVTRLNLVRALLSARELADRLAEDRIIRDHLIAELRKQPWIDLNEADIIVGDGVVQLWGCISSPEEGAAIRVAAENVRGVRRVESHLTIPKILI